MAWVKRMIFCYQYEIDSKMNRDRVDDMRKSISHDEFMEYYRMKEGQTKIKQQPDYGTFPKNSSFHTEYATIAEHQVYMMTSRS